MAVLLCGFAGFAAQAADAPQSKSVQKAPAPAEKTAAKPAAADRLTLDTTTVSGNRELPKVLYIVPWKKADLGNLPGQPLNTLLDEALAPVDREVFRREVDYYGILTAKPEAAKAGAQP